METQTPGEALRLAADAASRAVPLVIAVGGDGTLNEVINGVTDEDGRSRAVVGVIMTGRGRDAARNLGLPRNPLEAARHMVEGSEVALDLGLARWPGGQRFFVNSLGAGFDAAVAARAARLGGGGTIPYLGAVAQSLMTYRPVDMAVEVDESRRSSGPAAAVIVSNGSYFGGGMRIAPAADPTDGVLDLVELGPLGRWELLCWLPTLYWGGHVRNRHVRLARARRVRIDSPAPLPLELDGELCGRTPVEVRVCPGGLRLRR